MNDQQDDAPFVEAITRHQPELRSFCRSQIANQTDAKDILQKTNLKLWEKRSDWNPSTKFITWAFSVARFTVLSHFRDSGRDRLVFDADVAELVTTPLTRVLDDYPERLEALHHCMELLPKKKRQLLQLHYQQTRPLKEIASSTGRSLSAVKVSLHRIRNDLSQCIRQRIRAAN